MITCAGVRATATGGPARALAAAGWGTVTFTANSHAAAALGLSGPQK